MIPLLLARLVIAGEPEPIPRACEPLSTAELQQRVERSQHAMRQGQVAVVEALHMAIEHDLPCLDAVPDASLWAAHLERVAMIDLIRGEDWQPALRSAFYADPTLVLSVGPAHPFAAFRPSEDRDAWTPTPPGLDVALDGRPVTALPTAAGTHLLQVRGASTLHTAWLRGESPATHTLLSIAPRPPERAPGRHLRRAGLTLLVGGGVLGAGTWAVSRLRPRLGKAGDDALVGMNVGGWSLAAVGSGSWVWGVHLGRRKR